MANFKQSQAMGSFGERVVQNYLRLAGIECELNTDKTKRSEYDLVCKIGKKSFSVEVKLDWLSNKTGNLAVEYENERTGLPSGLSVSKSHVWAVLIRDSDNWVVFLTKTEALRKYVKDNKGRIIVGAGDGNANIILYPTEDILKIFTRIDNLHIEDLNKVIKGLLK